MSNKVSFYLKFYSNINGYLGMLKVSRYETINDLRIKVSDIFNIKENFKIFYQNKILQDSNTLEQYHINDKDIIYLDIEVDDHQKIVLY